MGLFDGTPLQRPVRCEECNELLEACICPETKTPIAEPASQRLSVRVERRKHGRLVTTVTGFSAGNKQIDVLLQMLKSQCGAGGTRENQTIEIQGDHHDRIRASLQASGYKVVG